MEELTIKNEVMEKNTLKFAVCNASCSLLILTAQEIWRLTLNKSRSGWLEKNMGIRHDLQHSIKKLFKNRESSYATHTDRRFILNLFAKDLVFINGGPKKRQLTLEQKRNRSSSTNDYIRRTRPQ